MKIIFGGHWESPPEGWIALGEQDQDITKRLKFDDNSVDVIFTEHVIEHINFLDGVGFMRESLRILKPGGIFRAVAPMADQLVKYKADDLGKEYARFCILPRFPDEEKMLRDLGLPGIETDPLPFVLHSLLKFHNHQFVWSSGLMAKVLKKVGFWDANVTVPGESNYDESSAMERRVRGLWNLPEGMAYYDAESLVVEAVK